MRVVYHVLFATASALSRSRIFHIGPVDEGQYCV